METDWKKKYSCTLTRTEEVGRLSRELEETRSKLNREIINLVCSAVKQTTMNKKLQNSLEAVEAEKGELDFTLENVKKQAAKADADHGTP